MNRGISAFLRNYYRHTLPLRDRTLLFNIRKKIIWLFIGYPVNFGFDSPEKRLKNFANYLEDKCVLNAGSGLTNIKFCKKQIKIDIDLNTKPDIVADIHNIPFKDNSLDAIVSFAVLEHCVFPWDAVKEFRRVTKRGGYIICGIPWISPRHNAPIDCYRFSDIGLRALFEYSNLKVIKINTVHSSIQGWSWITYEILKSRKILRFLLIIVNPILILINYTKKLQINTENCITGYDIIAQVDK